jgi:hypothetical protein
MGHMISVTPVDEMDGDRHIVRMPIFVNPFAIRKIESVEVEAPKPSVPKVEAGDREPLAAPVKPSDEEKHDMMMVSLITFIDGKTMHVKDDMASIRALVA